jgi:SNF2 family DNA or RNA helicase
MIGARVERGRIFLAAPFELKDRIKALPGATWDRTSRRWHVPATPHGAGPLQALGRVVGGVDACPLTQELFRLRANSAAAQGFKTCPIDEVPTVSTKTPQWEHQRRGTAFALSQTACLLFWGMGCGKTKATIDIVCGAGGGFVLVLCPKAVIDVWPHELDKHSALPFEVLTLTKGTTKKKAIEVSHFFRRHSAQAGQVLRVVVVNYESAWRDDLAKEILKHEWDCVVLDEIHRIKSPSGKASKFCAKLRPKSKRMLGLSGTVMPHGPMDAYAIFRALDPGIFGSNFTAFKSKYGIMGGFQGRQVVNYQNLDDLGERMELITFHASRDLLDLPPETDVERWIDLSTAEAKFYSEIETELCAEVERGEVTAQNALVKLLKLQQATGGFAVTDDGDTVHIGDSRRKALADVLEDIPPAEPVVVFCKFRADLDSVHAVARQLGRGSLELSGRRNDLKVWQGKCTGCGVGPVLEVGDVCSNCERRHAQTPPPILATQIQAGGIGVDLTRASVACYYSIGFSLGDFDQAKARIHRPGQRHHVTNVHLIARGTVDVAIRKALARKEDVIDRVLYFLKGEDDGR